jgi:hypothetical protein
MNHFSYSELKDSNLRSPAPKADMIPLHQAPISPYYENYSTTDAVLDFRSSIA